MHAQVLRRLLPIWLGALALLSSCDEVEDQLPLAAALDYVYQHPEYMFADAGDELITGVVPEGRAAKLDRHLAGDWVARSIASVDEDADEIDWAWQAVALTRDTMISQREPDIYLLSNDFVYDEGFEDAAFARLVRGFGNCDSINYTLAMLLRTRDGETGMRHIDDSPDGRYGGGHTITTLPGRGGPIFTDAWADFGLMVLSDDVAPEVPTYDEVVQADEDPNFDGIYARVQYELSGPMAGLELFYGLRDEQGPDVSIPQLPPLRDARDAYLRARVFHLYGLHDEALALYRKAVDMSCHDTEAPICRLATVFEARMAAQHSHSSSPS